MESTASQPPTHDRFPEIFPGDGGAPTFARAYADRRGLRSDASTLQLVQLAVHKYRGPLPIAWRELERFVDRVLIPRGPDPS